MSTPYLGSKISLISRLDIRYEGILYTVDSNESTIALAKVRSFGTENRPTDHPVKARDEVYEYIIFKASDIKDLVVCEGPKQPDIEYDPAIVSVSKPPVRSEPPAQSSSNEQKTPPASVQAQVPVNKTLQPSDSDQPSLPPYHQKQPWKQDNRQQQQQQNRQQYRPFHQQQRPVYQNPRPNVNRPFNRTTPKEKLKFDTDFDFVKANEDFREKLDVVTDELAEKIVFNAENEETNSIDENGDKDSSSACYNKKSSFFDSISCEALEKAEGRSTRPDWRKERQTNCETFGQNSVRSHAYHNYRRFQGGYRQDGNRPSQQRYNPRQNNNGPDQQGNRPPPPRFFDNNNQRDRQQNSRQQNRAFY